MIEQDNRSPGLTITLPVVGAPHTGTISVIYINADFQIWVDLYSRS